MDYWKWNDLYCQQGFKDWLILKMWQEIPHLPQNGRTDLYQRFTENPERYFEAMMMEIGSAYANKPD